MSQTLTRLLIHLVFSTKDRRPLIPEGAEDRLYAYLGGICRSSGCVLLGAGGTPDHVHLLVSLTKSISVVDLMLPFKRDSSAWMKEIEPDFYWQDGYGAFSVGESQVGALRAYFARQKEHHRAATFQDEYCALLTKYGVEFNERYVWG